VASAVERWAQAWYEEDEPTTSALSVEAALEIDRARGEVEVTLPDGSRLTLRERMNSPYAYKRTRSPQ
jgi:hypothetical protein